MQARFLSRLFEGRYLATILSLALLPVGVGSVAADETAILAKDKTAKPEIQSAAGNDARVMAYEGFIAGVNGNAIADGEYNFTFAIYTTATGGSPVWSEQHTGVTVKDGLVQVSLGRGTEPHPLDLPFNTQYYLGVRMSGDAEMLPRLELSTAAYSFRSRSADTVADGAITKNKLAAGSVTDDKIESVDWAKITGIPPEGNAVPASVWHIRGNLKTDSSVNFVGTADYQALVFRTNYLERMKITEEGKVEMRDDLLVEGYVTSAKTPDSGGFFLADMSHGLKRSPGNDVELFTTNGNLLLNSVMVGISTNTPSSKLSIKGGGLAVGNTYAEAPNTAPASGAIFEGDVGIGDATPNAKLHVNGSGVALRVDQGGSERLTVNGSGNVGVGIPAASASLHVSSSGRAFQVDQGGAERLVVNSSGNVGVGGNSYGNVQLSIHSDPATDYVMDAVVTGTDNKFAVHNSGRVVITSELTGAQNNTGNYPLFVDGKDQGVAIRIAGQAQDENNFVSFWHNTNQIAGRIEGQTAGEYALDAVTIATDVYFVAIGVAEGVAIAAAIVEPSGVISLGAQLVYTGFLEINNLANAGVAYASGSGDYAEWLMRFDADEEIESGDIVGVSGGRITRSTKDAQQVLAISQSPIVLGNMPPEGDEHLYEKVAFLGQVPVKVRGTVNGGDYILPSGLNDGTGIAVSPEQMTADEYARVVGRAWGASNDSGVKMIKVAVGLNAGDVANVVSQQEVATRKMKGEIQALSAQLNEMSVLSEKVARLEAAMERMEGQGQAASAHTAGASK